MKGCVGANLVFALRGEVKTRNTQYAIRLLCRQRRTPALAKALGGAWLNRAPVAKAGALEIQLGQALDALLADLDILIAKTPAQAGHIRTRIANQQCPAARP